MNHPSFPLKVSPNRRYLVDQNGQPFLLHAETGWRMINALPLADACEFMDGCQALGFNTLFIHAINKEITGYLDAYGHAPFEPPFDLTHPAEPYWQYLDELIAQMTQRGLYLGISAAWLGFQGEDWRYDLEPAAARAYGRFIGQRYARYTNILWILGGDNNPGDRAEAMHQLAHGIRESASHLLTYHAQAEFSSAAHFNEARWLNLNMAYTYGVAYKHILPEYTRPHWHNRPIILGETGYEGESNTGFVWTAEMVRAQAYHALLSGACGHAHGTQPMWQFRQGWREGLTLDSTRQMAYVYNLLASRPWWQLIPDVAHRLTPFGWRSLEEAANISAAATPDGRLALCYIPTPRTFSVDLTQLARPLTARWYSPVTGTYQPDAVADTFTSPSAGDWVLVLEADC